MTGWYSISNDCFFVMVLCDRLVVPLSCLVTVWCDWLVVPLSCLVTVLCDRSVQYDPWLSCDGIV